MAAGRLLFTVCLFVRSCCGRFEQNGGSPFPDTSLLRDGSWDETKLREAAIECRLSDPWSRYQDLLELELEMRVPRGPDPLPG